MKHAITWMSLDVKRNKSDTKEHILILSEGQVIQMAEEETNSTPNSKSSPLSLQSSGDEGCYHYAPMHRPHGTATPCLSFSTSMWPSELLEVWSCTHSLMQLAMPQSPELEMSKPQSACLNRTPLPVRGLARRILRHSPEVRRLPVVYIRWSLPEHVCR